MEDYMRTSVDEIRQWLVNGQKQNATHLIVACDTFSNDDYPVYVLADENVRETAARINNQVMTRLMEVYCYAMDLEAQLRESRAMHFDAPTPKEKTAPSSFCCPMMKIRVLERCPIHRVDCVGVVMRKISDHSFGIPIHDGGSSFIAIDYCPWCGKRLSEGLTVNETLSCHICNDPRCTEPNGKH